EPVEKSSAPEPGFPRRTTIEYRLCQPGPPSPPATECRKTHTERIAAMKTLASLTLALLALSFAGAEDTKETKFDPAKMVGEWKSASGVRAGEKIEKDHLVGKVVISKDTFTIPAGPDQKFIIAYKIDNKATPAKIDMDIKDGPVKEGKSLGIIAFDGDK